eukprot:CAMPEP_0204863226 /NCGR_PEP_ID=MMETSP1348-20121228/3157_1 /ASSEMBLY_ACC=CAM_ASM_000700 /TAXON_ID=215587 /ORGANISM="Aplanochytrium stocchinoi, Strain GSBS06" /LENGTH=376 /DNA_ID=CAMNT_0052013493 /DNA_START=108 /DNA_END=1238 /DNA_ORIENTATION=+
MRTQDLTDSSIGARKPTEQVHLISTAASVALSGGQNIEREGYLYARSEGAFGWLNGWKKKYLKLEFGKFVFYSLKEVEKYGAEEALEEGEINLADIRRIDYQNRTDKKFALVLGSEGANRISSRMSFRKRSRSNMSMSMRSSMGSNLTDASSSYKETKVFFKADSCEEIEDWIQHLLLELKNQALILDKTADLLMRKDNTSNVLESLLRQSVDLWTLAVGKIHEKTAEAQERLTELLEKSSSKGSTEEAEFWTASTNKIREQIQIRCKILKNLDETRLSSHVAKANFKEILDEMRRERTTTSGTTFKALEEIQEEFELFGVLSSKKRQGLNQAERWRMLSQHKKEFESNEDTAMEKIDSGSKLNVGLSRDNFDSLL